MSSMVILTSIVAAIFLPSIIARALALIGLVTLVLASRLAIPRIGIVIAVPTIMLIADRVPIPTEKIPEQPVLMRGAGLIVVVMLVPIAGMTIIVVRRVQTVMLRIIAGPVPVEMSAEDAGDRRLSRSMVLIVRPWRTCIGLMAGVPIMAIGTIRTLAPTLTM